MEIGDYIRYKEEGVQKIGRAIKIDVTFLDNEEEGYYETQLIKVDNGDVIIGDDLLKSGKGILHEIEVGDYVNGHEVLEKYHDELRLNTENDVLCFIKEKDIKTILTKEQFEAMKYVVRRD